MSIPLNELVVGTVYKLNSRNLSLGVFTSNKGFIGIRTKFGNRFLFQEFEYTTDPHYGTAQAIEVLGVIPDTIKLTESVGTRCEHCKREVNFDIKRPEKEHWHHKDDGTVICPKAFPFSVNNDTLFSALEEYESRN